MTPRPPWLTEVDGVGSAPGPGPLPTFPRPGWPPLESLDYAIKIITLLVLILALPWILAKFANDGHLSRHAASVAPLNAVE